MTIVDGNAIFYFLKELPPNFKSICEKIFDKAIRGYYSVFSTDMYFENSIKSLERIRRGCGEKLIISGPNVKKHVDWKSFLTNEENKRQLIEMLVQVWSSEPFMPKLVSKDVIINNEDQAILLTSDNGENIQKTVIRELCSDQEETDTRVILYCNYAQRIGYMLESKAPIATSFSSIYTMH